VSAGGLGCGTHPGARPELSIVTLTMDEPDRLLETIESIDKQRGIAIEHIIVNGGRPGLWANESGTWLSRVQINAEPQGIYPAMNVGLSEASAPAIMFINSGDRLFRSDSARTAVALLSRSRWGYGALIAMRDGTARVKYPRPLDRWLVPLGAGYVPHPATIMETSLVRDRGGFETEFGGAADQWQMLVSWQRYPPAITATPLAVHLVDGVSSDRDPDSVWAEYAAMRKSMEQPVLGARIIDESIARSVIAARKARRRLRRAATVPTNVRDNP
jgi:hypothetical protein